MWRGARRRNKLDTPQLNRRSILQWLPGNNFAKETRTQSENLRNWFGAQQDPGPQNIPEPSAKWLRSVPQMWCPSPLTCPKLLNLRQNAPWHTNVATNVLSRCGTPTEFGSSFTVGNRDGFFAASIVSKCSWRWMMIPLSLGRYMIDSSMMFYDGSHWIQQHAILRVGRGSYEIAMNPAGGWRNTNLMQEKLWKHEGPVLMVNNANGKQRLENRLHQGSETFRSCLQASPHGQASGFPPY